MDQCLLAVILSFILYVLYVILPMIPAVLIYRWFPNTKVGLKGPLANLTIKASGAFAAYVITVILGFFLVKNTHYLIAGMPRPTWTIKARVELRNHDNNKVTSQHLFETLQVYVTPDVKITRGEYVELKLPSEGKQWPHPYITFVIPNFGEETIDISQLGYREAIRNELDKIFEIQQPIVIKTSELYERSYKHDDVLKSDQDPSKGPPLGKPQ